MLTALICLDVFFGVCVIASFPILCFTPFMRFAFFLFSTGFACHYVLHWFFDFKIVAMPGEFPNDDDQEPLGQ